MVATSVPEKDSVIIRGRYVADGIATRVGPGQQMNCGCILGRGKEFFATPNCPGPVWNPPSLELNWIPSVQWPQRKALSLPSAEIISPLPYTEVREFTLLSYKKLKLFHYRNGQVSRRLRFPDFQKIGTWKR
jgi:hypothetical protein